MLSAVFFRYKGNTDKQMVQLNFYNSQGIYICIFITCRVHIFADNNKKPTHTVLYG